MADTDPTLFDEARFDEAGPTSLKGIARAIEECRRCPIGANGTHAVMGEGPRNAALMIVGEQPGDNEEEQGRPFVGPAGQLLDRYLDDAGIDREQAYLTNTVKHFKFVQRGKRRLHDKPNAGEIDTCRWWVDGERQLIEPKLVLAMGVSAARGMLGKTVSLRKFRGAPQRLEDGSELWITVHPSYLLRLKDDSKRTEGERFAADLSKVAARLAELSG